MPKQQATLEEILEASASDFPKMTALGKKSLKIEKAKKKIRTDEKDALIQRLELLKKEIDKPRRKKKTKNILDRSSKEILSAAVYELCAYFTRNMDYDARWIRNALEENWKVGRPLEHSYEKHIRCAQLIHFSKNKKISKREAIALTNQIYKFNRTDALDTYFEFKGNLEKYYFPEIRIREHIPIYIILDVMENGRNPLKGIVAKDKTIAEFEKIMTDAIELLKKEIQFTQKNKLNKLGVEINPTILKWLEIDSNNVDLIWKEKSGGGAPDSIFRFTRQFLDDLELLNKVIPAKYKSNTQT